LNSVHASRLNEDQRKIIKYALAQNSQPMAPLVVYGAFGTGKTETLAETARTLASIPGNRTRILICTHTNAYVSTRFCNSINTLIVLVLIFGNSVFIFKMLILLYLVIKFKIKGCYRNATPPLAATVP